MGGCCSATGDNVVERKLESAGGPGIRDAFLLYDKNGNGVIEKSELRAVLTEALEHDVTQIQLNKIFESVDTNHDKVISFKEFKAMMEKRDLSKNEFLKMFEVYDLNHDGFITRDELTKVMNEFDKTSDDEVDLVIKAADQNDDEKIDYLEFLDYFM